MSAAPDSFSPTQRAALRVRAEQAREQARALAAQALVLRAEAEQKVCDAETAISVANELSDCLKEVVRGHARLSRSLNDPPERVIVEIKEVATDAIATARSKGGRHDPRDGQLLREQLVRWAIDGHFGPGPLSS